MKKSTSKILILVGFAFLFSCHKQTANPSLPGTWTRQGDFAGIGRQGGVSFVIGNYSYVGTGYNYASNVYLNDFWRYDPTLDAWTPIANFPGLPRTNAVAFSLNGKGYVGTGLGGGPNQPIPLSDFYQYDPTQNKWTQVADFGSPSTAKSLARYGSVGFTVNGKAFVGSGRNGSIEMSDFWQYDDLQNRWNQINDIGNGNGGRHNSWAMIIGNFAYVGGGSNNGSMLSDFWMFDPTSTNSWSSLEKSNPQLPNRELASTFTIGDYGYLFSGSNNSYTNPLGDDMWQYNPPPMNKWLLVTFKTINIPHSRESGVAFSIGNFGYATTGGMSSLCYDDCWIFTP